MPVWADEEALPVDPLGKEPSVAIPPRPEPPLSSDCCGSGCARCVNDVYAEELAEWEKRYGGNSA